MGKNFGGLVNLPPELVISIFRFLPSFRDAFSFAVTCCRVRSVWTEHKTQIYTSIAPRCIECEPYARQLLVDQGGPSLGSPLSDRDIVRVLQNAQAVERAVDGFEAEYVSSLRPRFVGTPRNKNDTIYGGKAGDTKLTPTERLRFVRAWYQTQSLLEIAPAECSSRLTEMRLRELFYAHDIAQLDLEGIRNNNEEDAGKRYFLGLEIRKAIVSIWQKEYGLQAPNPRTAHDTYEPFVVIWDYYQYNLKSFICWSSLGRERGPCKEPKLHLWDAEPEDERLIEREEEERKAKALSVRTYDTSGYTYNI